MTELVPRRLLRVVLDVLPQRSTEGNVDELLTAADAQHGNVRVDRPVRRRKLDRVQTRVDVGRWMRRFTIGARVDIGSTWKDDPVQAFQDRQQRLWA